MQITIGVISNSLLKKSGSTKMNYLSIIYDEHIEKPYCINGWSIGVCTTCGCSAIRTRIFNFIVSELDINPEQTGTRKYYRSLSNVQNATLLRKMIENLCETLNKLSDRETRRIGEIDYGSDVPRFMHSSFLVFLVLEIWVSLRTIYEERQREDALKYFLGNIQNNVVHKLITSMDDHFKAHRYRQDLSKNQF